MKGSFKYTSVAMSAALITWATGVALTPWEPRNVQEELSIYEDIVEAQIIEEDKNTDLSAANSEKCLTTYAAAAVTRVLKGSRKIGDKILLGGLPLIEANFPMKRGNDYVLLLQKDLSNDGIVDYYRHECPKSELLRRTAKPKRLFAGVYTGYKDFAIKSKNGESTVAVWTYRGETGWKFLEGYSFDQNAADPNRRGILLLTPHEKFLTHLEKSIELATNATIK